LFLTKRRKSARIMSPSKFAPTPERKPFCSVSGMLPERDRDEIHDATFRPRLTFLNPATLDI
ncbi:MAG: hypothetical protein ACXU8S_00465, partial [Phenylobacterium sp.]